MPLGCGLPKGIVNPDKSTSFQPTPYWTRRAKESPPTLFAAASPRMGLTSCPQSKGTSYFNSRTELPTTFLRTGKSKVPLLSMPDSTKVWRVSQFKRQWGCPDRFRSRCLLI